VLHDVGDVRILDVPDPVITQPTDAVVRILVAAVCGSDLWPYRGLERFRPGDRMGHEWIGLVEDIGAQVATVRRGDLVVAPFAFADGTCPHCRDGVPTSCPSGGFRGGGNDSGQAEAARVPEMRRALHPSMIVLRGSSRLVPSPTPPTRTAGYRALGPSEGSRRHHAPTHSPHSPAHTGVLCLLVAAQRPRRVASTTLDVRSATANYREWLSVDKIGNTPSKGSERHIQLQARTSVGIRVLSAASRTRRSSMIRVCRSGSESV
jgi:hypothetical protein